MKQDTSKLFKFGGLEARFDVSDFRQMEKAEAAIVGLNDLEERTEAALSPVEKLKTMFYAFAGVIDQAFDNPDAANLALGGTASLDDVVSAVLAFIEFVQKQDQEIADRWSSLTSKYSPKQRNKK